MIGSLETDGFYLAPHILDQGDIADLLAVTDRADMTRSKRNDDVFGARNLLDVTEIAVLARSATLMSLVRPVLGADAIPFEESIFFDETPGANWPVAQHGSDAGGRGAS